MKQLIGAFAAAFFLVAAAPLPAPGRDQILADIHANGPETLTFDRITKSVRTGGGSKTTTALVERWNGKGWTLISQNGKRPSDRMRDHAAKLAAANPVPGYYRLKELISASGETGKDAEGRTIFTITTLPADTVRTENGDISDHLKGEITIVNRAGKFFVERLRFVQRESFKMNLLIKVIKFEQVFDYRLDDKGVPRLTSQTATSAGTMFDFPGGETSQVTFAYRQ